MPRAVDGLIVEREAVALLALAVRALQDGHFIGESALLEVDNAADTGRIVGSVGLKGARIQGAAEALAHFEEFLDGIRLVAVGDDDVVLHALDGRIDDERGICHFARIERIDGDVVPFLLKDTVAGVLAPAHDEVGEHRLSSVRGLADDNAAPGIGISRECALHALSDVTHINSPFQIMSCRPSPPRGGE